MWIPEIRGHDGALKAVVYDHLGFSFSRRLSGRGWLQLRLDQNTKTVYGGRLIDAIMPDDQIILYNPSSDFRNPDAVFFVQQWEISETEGGTGTIVVYGPDQNALLGRRIVNYFSGHPNARMIDDTEGNIIQRVVDTNLYTGASSSRQMPSEFSMDTTPRNLGEETRMSFAWKNVFDVLTEISDGSRENGGEVFWNVELSGLSSDGIPLFEFVVVSGYPGGDKTLATSPGGSPVIFSPELGNLKSPRIVWDYSDEANAIIVGGPGEGRQRKVLRVQDDERIARSQWGRKEKFVDARNQSGGDLARAARAALNEGRPKIYFSGQILSTPEAPYGKWRLGSLVSVAYAGFSFDVLVRTVNVTVSSDGQTSIFSNLELEDAV